MQCHAILFSSATHRTGRSTKWKAILFQNRILAQRVDHQKGQYSRIPKLQGHIDDNNQPDFSLQVQASKTYNLCT